MVEVPLTHKFKVGDRVRRIMLNHACRDGLKVGEEGIITTINGDWIIVDTSRFKNLRWYLELVTPAAPKTDQELADEYRRGQNICWDARCELESRGFVTKWNGKPMPTLIPANKIVECEFEKVTTTTVVEKI
jgi:hypothetical protein